jgi:uncharacterized protein (TIGR02246 family)
MEPSFDPNEIRAAERALEQALESTDPGAWVYAYTEDAVFVGPGSPAVEGRAALLDMARAMKPLSMVSIRTLRIEGSGNVACCYAHASWVSGRYPEAGSATHMRGILVWRKEADGQWRVAMELLNIDPAPQ